MSRAMHQIRLTTGLYVSGAIGVVILACNSAAALPPLPSMACPVISAKDAPQLDGSLDEAVWAEGDVQTRYHRWYGRLERPQGFRLLTDGEWLYIGFIALVCFDASLAFAAPPFPSTGVHKTIRARVFLFDIAPFPPKP